MHCCGSARKIPVILLALMFLAAARQASAELLFFSGDRTMSVKSHRLEGDQIVVSLRGGGEMTFDRAVIVRIGPDEVSYDEPVVPASGGVSTSPATNRLLENTVFEPLILEASLTHGVDARLVKAVIQTESAYQPAARSPKGAMGLMQLMPQTAKQYQARSAYDPRTNIDAGVKYLRTLLDQFELPLAIAAYNAGEGAVRRFGGIPPFPETQAYVAKVLSLYR